MLKKLLLVVSTLVATMGLAFAEVDVNKADKAALDGIKGVGPKMSQTILDERQKGGAFKDWADFQSRVKGVKSKAAIKLSQAGLTVNGQALPGADEAKAEAKGAKAETKPGKAKTAAAKDKPAAQSTAS